MDLYERSSDPDRKVMYNSSDENLLVNYNPKTTVECIVPGMVILKNFLSLSQQQRIIDIVASLGKGPGGFYRPIYASGAKCKLDMMCWGKHWNVKTESYESLRSNYDHVPVLPFPIEFKSLISKAIEMAFIHDDTILGTCAAFDPDICVVNFYSHSGRNGLHQDKDESASTLLAGSPVVSFSIGCDADFAYCQEYPKKGESVPVVRLQSGDVQIFGGPSRMIVHALTRLYARTSPTELVMRPGRLNLTFREY